MLLSAKGLTKDFGNSKGAFAVDIDVNEGEVIGFLGPNGAGKTTTMLMLTGMVYPDSGSVTLLGKTDIKTPQIHTQMANMGIIFSEQNFPDNLTSKEIFSYNAKLLNRDLNKEIDRLISLFEIDTKKKFHNLSQGNKRKVSIVNAIMHRPKLLILDEPTSGLDPLIQQKFLDELRSLRDDGSGILLSSHVLSEVETICDRIVMIKQGKIVRRDTKENILQDELKIFLINQPKDQLLQELAKLPHVVDQVSSKDRITLYSKDRKAIIDLLVKHKHYDFYLQRPTLEKLFIKSYE